MYDFTAALEKLKSKNLYRNMLYLDSAQGPYTEVEGKNVLLLSSNNYLGLCNDERLKLAAISTIKEFGVGSGGSRLTTGSYKLHKELEAKLATFKGTESALVFSTGYATNVGTLSALADPDWVIFCDRLNHGSIIDGCRLSGAKLVVYKHCDVEDLEKKIKRYHRTNGKGLIVTDGVFSMDGDLAPLPAIVDLAKKYNLLTMVDDAHGTGVLGATGSGTVAHYNLQNQVDIQMGTLSKAFASEGGYIAGHESLITYIRHKAKSFIYSTAPAPHTIAISLKALEIIQEDGERRKSLSEKSQWFRRELTTMGFQVPMNDTPIIPLLIGEADLALQYSKLLFEAGLYVPAIRPPTVPQGTSRLRFSIMATHSYEDLSLALEKIYTIGKELNLIK
ncbi:8-amino-7-oxononanoate synthase [Heliorestis acidaminivorans]|uniref:8-amino-7-ketopelargonate synthase n=1 Tax=Heliorestis acidaminivorans TaxID=553427 RepID=A0A6I0F4N9_9FIRM|nr:8-amino-7-oxononanoate synthase [Heliorestis acidaminivorans]KAB2952180.1 8-amino-7-oxononanoate synthase [Heliorestis acidaminivorans]